MNQSTIMRLMGMRIIGQHGREVGVIKDMLTDTDTWQLQSLSIKLNRETLDNLNLKRSWFGTQTVEVPVSAISGTSDTLVLKCPLEEMEFSGGDRSEKNLPLFEEMDPAHCLSDDAPARVTN